MSLAYRRDRAVHGAVGHQKAGGGRAAGATEDKQMLVQGRDGHQLSSRGRCFPNQFVDFIHT